MPKITELMSSYEWDAGNEIQTGGLSLVQVIALIAYPLRRKWRDRWGEMRLKEIWKQKNWTQHQERGHKVTGKLCVPSLCLMTLSSYDQFLRHRIVLFWLWFCKNYFYLLGHTKILTVKILYLFFASNNAREVDGDLDNTRLVISCQSLKMVS